jgi:small subunit ribosomal protein S3Ae
MAVKTAGLKVKAKTWFKIFAPKSFSNEVLGESLLISSEDLMGRYINVNLSLITGDMKKQGTVIKFKVIGVRPEGGNTEVVGYEVQPSTLRRFMRRAVKDIANSFECMTADNVRVRIKPVAFVSNRVKGSMATLLSRTIKFLVIKEAKSKNYVDLFNEVIMGKLQREIREKLNKIYSVRIFEIKALLKVEGEAKPLAEEAMEEMPHEVKEAVEGAGEAVAAEESAAEAEPKAEEPAAEIKEEIAEKIEEAKAE